MSKHQFQAEVNQLLTLIIHSLYSHTEIFLRELVSNASDALDKLKYLTLTQEEYKGVPFAPRIDISFDTKDRKTLTIADTGIGMNEKDLEENLGTIARSGTREFIQAMAADAKKGSSLIGQFGVGFYSSFMVADTVEVVTRKIGEEKAWKWTSDGKGEYEISRGRAGRRRHHGHPPPERGGQGIRGSMADRGHHPQVLQPHRLPHPPALPGGRPARREGGQGRPRSTRPSPCGAGPRPS